MATMTQQRKSTIRPKGLNMKDPKVRADLYMQTHGIKELFEGMGTLLLYHRPTNPRIFLAQHLAEIQRAKQSQTHVMKDGWTIDGVVLHGSRSLDVSWSCVFDRSRSLKSMTWRRCSLLSTSRTKATSLRSSTTKVPVLASFPHVDPVPDLHTALLLFSVQL